MLIPCNDNIDFPIEYSINFQITMKMSPVTIRTIFLRYKSCCKIAFDLKLHFITLRHSKTPLNCNIYPIIKSFRYQLKSQLNYFKFNET